MQAEAIEDSGLMETLDDLERLHEVRADAEARMFELAAHFADLNSGETLPKSARVLPGMERAVQVGGAGTPRMAEFAHAMLGARLQMSSWAARRYVADALDVRHRLPLIWARVVARRARVGHARTVATATRHLSVNAVAIVDAAMVEHVDGSLPWGRFLARLEGKIVAADPVVAAEREAARVGEQFAKRTRAVESGPEAGMAGFYIRTTTGLIARLDATVAFVADALAAFGDTDPDELRRVKAVAVLANPARAVELLAAFAALRSRTLDVPLDLGLPLQDPSEPAAPDDPEPAVESEGCEPAGPLERMDAFARQVGFTPTRLPDVLDPTTRVTDAKPFIFDWSKLLPPLTLNLHVAAEALTTDGGGVVRWEGEGPVTRQFVHDHLRPLHRYRIQPVIDLANQAPVDGYEIPDRHRRAVRLRTPADCFPYSPNTTSRVDVDHTKAYKHAVETESGGEQALQSRLDNYGPLGRFHHRIKTHGAWTVRQPFAGIYLWRDPQGQVYLVDHTGTHKITRPGHPAGRASSGDQSVEVYPSGVVIELDFSA